MLKIKATNTIHDCFFRMSSWPCLTCAHKDQGLCKELLNTAADDDAPPTQDSWQDFQVIQSGESIISRGKRVDYLYILCDGWAFQFNQLPNGRRQIIHLFQPNDVFSPVMAFLGVAPASIGALTAVRLSRIRLDAVHSRIAINSSIIMTIAQSCCDHASNVALLLTAVGQLNSEQRLAFLFLHLLKRAAKFDAINDLRFKSPLRQQHVADLLGLTPVHVNRVLRKFKSENIAELSNGFVTIHDLAEVERLGSIEN